MAKGRRGAWRGAGGEGRRTGRGREGWRAGVAGGATRRGALQGRGAGRGGRRAAGRGRGAARGVAGGATGRAGQPRPDHPTRFPNSHQDDTEQDSTARAQRRTCDRLGGRVNPRSIRSSRMLLRDTGPVCPSAHDPPPAQCRSDVNWETCPRRGRTADPVPPRDPRHPPRDPAPPRDRPPRNLAPPRSLARHVTPAPAT